MKQTILCLTAINLLSFTLPVNALNDSLSEKGIDVQRLQQPPYNLQGRKISIGQVEIGRPKKFALDKLNPLHKKLPIARLFYRNESAQPNTHIDNHAVMVASIMISNQKKLHGIAPLANLYSGAVGSLKTAAQPEECLTTQNIALQNSGNVSAINLSFGESLARDERKNPQLDGNALLTQCLDWSARAHNVLYVVAGNQGRGGIPIPTDQYNGITTAYSMRKDGIFSKVDFANLSISPVGIGKALIRQEINVDARRSVSLLAPGNKINVYNVDGKVEEVTGSSFAAPHITASVALLLEAGNNFLKENLISWTKDYRNHEVIKAILLNSADKLKDNGDGNLLGMTRNVLTQNNQTWLKSDAYLNPEIPLDMQMGTGHLNTMRAYQQLKAGQYNHKEKVSNIGWNYNQIEEKSSHDYIIKQPLKVNSYVSITLVWDRLVELNDQNNNQKYDIGENFINKGLNNLDLELISNDSKEKIVCSSVSKVDSVEHIFCPIPDTGEYKIRVRFTNQVNQTMQSYGLAWQTKGGI
jgi:Subtilase family